MARVIRSTGFQPYRRASQAHDNKTVRETEKHAIDPKFGRIVRKVCREKNVAHPKMSKTPSKFSAISRGKADASDLGHAANFSDNALVRCERHLSLAAGATMLCSHCHTCL
jgi:hypothetical protein